MWKAALAGAILATTGATFVSAQEYGSQYRSAYNSNAYSNFDNHAGETRASSQRVAMTDGHISRLKAVLKLTADQQRYWPAVESALRRLARRQSADRSSDGMVRRAAAAAVDAAAARRVASAAGPLISVLDEQQKQAGMRVVQALGFGHLAAAF